jgi:tetratricopeptide (TPR) repeat protein
VLVPTLFAIGTVVVSVRKRLRWLLLPALATLALVGVLSEAATARFPDVLQLRARLLQFAVFGYPKDGKDEQAARLYDYSEAHPDLIDHGIGAYSVTGGTRIEHARLLLRLGQEAKARDVLGEALEFLDDPAHVRPQDAVAAERSRGVILKLLGREQEAATALRAAVAADEANLAAAKNAEAEAWVRWSLAKTYVAAGQLDVALKETRIAYDRTPDAGLRKTITDWARNNVPPGL